MTSSDIEIINGFTSILEEFSRIPTKNRDSTYLELCQYPTRRFEEICSRLLAFYFDPQREHGLGELFIRSLLDLVEEQKIEKDIQIIEFSNLRVVTEDFADGKRIDLVIISDDFVIGIENKITASLYNPLRIYSKRLREYGKQITIKLVLSVFNAFSQDELTLMGETGFKPITYIDLFTSIKINIGDYIATCNQKYLTHLYDFIATIENMKQPHFANPEMAGFFIDNEEGVTRLKNAHDNYIKELRELHDSRLQDLRTEIQTKTKCQDWWVWGKKYLGISKGEQSDAGDYRIGIEGEFVPSKDGPYNRFDIYFTTWSKGGDDHYRSKLRIKYGELKPKNNTGDCKVMLKKSSFSGGDAIEICDELNECYQFIVGITADSSST
ncbi:MAG: PD-(D/E)XK nuclease family protein [Gammaproteobacteria bacterium]|nr:PD-(D/E)XK nuclease family protein [Gammaproteobacteria bacterium]MBU1655405.1 PD-(D/E)XK nuclease family protein [Gammaproteobacteria bacterium]MBU1960813.1 PD-(D/E)XK nuclease family protein [Gammaproteobacteria bacterium]